MFIPDVINTLLMGLIFMVIIVTVVRPFVLNMVGQAANDNNMHRAALDAVELELMRKAELLESQRAHKIKYQMLLLEKPVKPKPRPVLAPEPEALPDPETWLNSDASSEPVSTEQALSESDPALSAMADAASQTSEVGDTTANASSDASLASPDQGADETALAEGDIEIHEGESLAEIKERIRKEQQKTKKPTIPPELLNSANSYEDKVGVVRMVVQADQSRVASVIRSMIQIKK